MLYILKGVDKNLDFLTLKHAIMTNTDFRVTFDNSPSTNPEKEEFVKRSKSYLESFFNAMDFFMENDWDTYSDDYGDFNSYGLSFEFNEVTDSPDFWSYLITWGGPSFEIRYFADGTVVAAYLDWFTGIGYDITDTDAARFIKEAFSFNEDFTNFIGS